MKYLKLSAKLALFTAVFALTSTAFAQAAPAGTQKLEISAFVAGTGTFTGLEGGKNLGITAGADLTFLRFRRFRPAFEARGTYPINQGHISSQKNFLLGPKVEYPLGRFHPYADFLIGRGQIDYHAPGFQQGPADQSHSHRREQASEPCARNGKGAAGHQAHAHGSAQRSNIR